MDAALKNPTSRQVRRALERNPGSPRIIHTNKFAKGRMTPEEMHQKYAFAPGVRCDGCGRPPLTTVRVFLPLKEVIEKRGEEIGQLLMVPGGAEQLSKMCIETKDGPYIRASLAHACKACTPALERVAAKGAPSWAWVQISRGPGSDKLVTSG